MPRTTVISCLTGTRNRQPAAQYAWVPCGGGFDLDLADPSQQGNWDVDNTIKKSSLWPYCGNSVGVWHCPADRSLGQKA